MSSPNYRNNNTTIVKCDKTSGIVETMQKSTNEAQSKRPKHVLYYIGESDNEQPTLTLPEVLSSHPVETAPIVGTDKKLPISLGRRKCQDAYMRELDRKSKAIDKRYRQIMKKRYITAFNVSVTRAPRTSQVWRGK